MNEHEYGRHGITQQDSTIQCGLLATAQDKISPLMQRHKTSFTRGWAK